MSDNIVTISLPEMVDLALNTPEIGTINFNILHSLLHVIIQQIDLSGTKIQFLGFDGERVQNIMSQPLVSPNIHLTEYRVISDKTTKDQKEKDNFSEPQSLVKENSIVVVETKSSFDRELKTLKDDIKALKELPNNPDLIEAMRSNKDGPVLEMYQVLALTKRMDAAEQGLQKLASLLEDLSREHLESSSKLNFRLQTAEQNTKRCSVDPKVLDVEMKLNEYRDYVEVMDAAFKEQLIKLQEYLMDLEKDVGELIELRNASPSEDKLSNNSALFNTVMEVQEEVVRLSKMVTTIYEEKDRKQSYLDAIVEEIEVLKVVKADREDLEDALANKADACAINRKVSHDQFDATCDDLTKAIQDTLDKFELQEHVWQQALTNIEDEIQNKLDKIEFTPLCNFVTSKIEMLQERLKAIAALKKEAEAAGTKNKYLRNVQCISCDNEVVMRKDFDPAMFKQPSTRSPPPSMGPHLAYELDQMRNQRKYSSTPKSINYHTQTTKFEQELENTNHICNRYCGGSHTTTTPQQRVARVGHFIDQWSSQIKPELERVIVGTDGLIYKSKQFTEEEKSNKSEQYMMAKSAVVSERAIKQNKSEETTSSKAIKSNKENKEK